MNRLLNKLIISASLLTMVSGLQAQTMTVTESGGVESMYSISNVKKMTFSGGNVSIVRTDNSSDAYALNDVNHLTFGGFITSVDEESDLNTSEMTSYPNPVSDFLNVEFEGLNADGVLSVLTLGGEVILERKVNSTSTNTIDLRQLTEGVYICRLSNANGTKSVKIIKE